MSDEIIDLIIVGCGPAGLQAAMHASRKKASVLVFGRIEHSAIYSAHVENYLCVAGVTDGSEMMAVALEQVGKFGVKCFDEDVLSIEQKEPLFEVRTETATYTTRSLILATGTARKKLKVKGEKELFGKGVSYCVDCDANFYRNAKVAVVGNGSAAVDGALTLLGYTPDVTLICRELDVADELKEKVENSAIQLKLGAWVKEIVGENAVQSVVLEDDSALDVEGVFVELGAKGALELAVNLGVQLDMETCTHINANKKQATNIRGIYAAGDIAGQPYQMAKAVGEGCVAGWEAANYANKMKRDAKES